ncbi:DUF402 domain-containing protein [Effusibacillus consociatus]|uniref:DUF402 domain-containing protein n=1 Tax=Effusibacillus consociatus TaxID=1117041 RepID=A0ABV9Q564_9BACL
MSIKHDGFAHRSWDAAVVLEEEPLRLAISPHTPVRNSDGSVWTSDYEVEAYFHPEYWFNAFLLKKSDGSEWYCNVAAPPLFNKKKNEVHFVDYDLDVYVYADGSFKVLDRDEYEENAQRMRYSEEIRDKVEEGLRQLLQAISERREPFSYRV